MLDLIKLARQMQGIGKHLTDEAAATRRRLDLARIILEQARQHQPDLVNQLRLGRDRLGFAAAEPLELLDTCIDIAVSPDVHTVLATDGSQIAPSHHEIAYCYLINVGRVALHYGTSRYPLLDSVPEIFYRPEDLYISRQWGIRTEEWMGYRRTVSEAIALPELARHVGLTDHQATPPALAMVDGSLIHWFLEPLPADARDRILPPILEAWDQLREQGIPLVGYLSAARSGESLNFLRLHTCPYDSPNCLSHCPGQTETAPCQVFSPLRDTALWAVQLQPGQRGAIWRSSASVLDWYGEQRICFCYINVGAEIARLEFPLWVAEQQSWLDQALSLTLAQVQKGYGYPVALAEAHNQAVVRGSDRARFFALLERQMIKAGLKNIGTSYKEARKRGSIA
jgi:hypothetical protein